MPSLVYLQLSVGVRSLGLEISGWFGATDSRISCCCLRVVSLRWCLRILVSDVGFQVWGSRFMVWDRSGFLRYSVLGIRFFWRSGCEVSFLGIGFGVLPVYFWPERLHETCVFVRHWVAGDILQCYSHVTCNTQKVIRLLGTLHSLLIDFAPRILWWKMLWRWRRRWSSSLWSRWSWWWFCSEWWRWRSLPKWQKFYNTHNIASLAPNSRTCLVTLQRHKCKLQLPAGECANDEWGVMLGIWGFHEWCQCMKKTMTPNINLLSLFSPMIISLN